MKTVKKFNKAFPVCAILSCAVILFGIIGFFVRGINFGILLTIYNNSRALISRYLLITSTDSFSGVVNKAMMPRCLSEETMRRCS